ncbi:hypothetical protein [Bacillus sp. FJAT-45066]|uniref:hypothetical protein n=1 Tax=Bacillus sp. FJAT-45066 TaxID=2011010 RepID=UPI0020D07B85|nr:hypothetical protein [Bacillus sp. FJAT-45066]
MPKIISKLNLLWITVLGAWVFFKRKKNVGYTMFVPTGVRHEFPLVDLKEQKVVGTVIYKDKIYMKVIVNLKEDSVTVEDNVDELSNLSMDRESYINLFKSQAKFFVENNISDPEKYYEELEKQS